MKYDGFPRETDGSCFFDRKFVPVAHRMMEIALHYGESEYEINLSSPDNFYVEGNKLLDPAFLKWFIRKNHGVSLDLKGAAADECNYTVKCIDNNANLHTLQPCNYLQVCETGFEVHDSGLVWLDFGCWILDLNIFFTNIIKDIPCIFNNLDTTKPSNEPNSLHHTQ